MKYFWNLILGFEFWSQTLRNNLIMRGNSVFQSWLWLWGTFSMLTHNVNCKQVFCKQISRAATFAMFCIFYHATSFHNFSWNRDVNNFLRLLKSILDWIVCTYGEKFNWIKLFLKISLQLTYFRNSGRATRGARGAIAPPAFRNCHIKMQ